MSATWRETSDHRFAVSVRVSAKKLRADDKGNEQEIRSTIWWTSASSAARARRRPLFLEKRRVTQFETTFEVVADAQPTSADRSVQQADGGACKHLVPPRLKPGVSRIFLLWHCSLSSSVSRLELTTPWSAGASGFRFCENGLVSPTVLKSGPYRFFFFAGHRNEPPHVHVGRDRKTAKYWLSPVRVSYNYGFAENELNRIQGIVHEHETELLKAWHDYSKPGN